MIFDKVTAFEFQITVNHPIMINLCNLNLCLTNLSIFLTLSNTSVYNLVLISIKRLTVLSKGQRQKMRPKKYVMMEIATCWIISVLAGFAPFLFYKKESNTCNYNDILEMGFIIFRFIYVFVVPLIVMIYVHTNIYRLIAEQAQKKVDRNKDYNPCEPSNQKSIDKEIRATISIAIIVLIFSITWIPHQILHLLSIMNIHLFPFWVFKLSITLLHLNSVINPLIYAYRMRDIRRAIYRLFGVKRLSMNSSTTWGGVKGVPSGCLNSLTDTQTQNKTSKV
ncbi:hypothetical protein ACKWTF_003773 [Chironomus riparius]